MASSTPAVRGRASRAWPAEPGPALLTILALTAVLYLVEGVDQILGEPWDVDGIIPRQPEGVLGILRAPFLHAGWDHLIANTVPFIVLGFLVQSDGFGQFLKVTATIVIVGGAGVWLTGVSGVHLGASGLIFGWLTFLLVRGVLVRSGPQIFVAVIVFAAYGSVLWGVLPRDPTVSWQGHLYGALAGVLAAWLVANDWRRPVRSG